MHCLTRLIFGMALAAAAPAASLLVVTYSHQAASSSCPVYDCGVNGPALTGTRAEPGRGFPEAAEGPAKRLEGTNTLSLQGLTIYGRDPGVTVNSVSLNGSSFQGLDPNGLRVNDTVGGADPSRLRLRAIRLPGE